MGGEPDLRLLAVSRKAQILCGLARLPTFMAAVQELEELRQLCLCPSLTVMALMSQKMIISLMSSLQMTMRMVRTAELQSGKRCLLFSAEI